MSAPKLPRRRLLQLAGCSSLALVGDPLLAQQVASQQAFASALLFALVPNRDVPGELYHSQAALLIASESGRAMLQSSRDALRELTGHDWMVLDAESRITTLLRLSNLPQIRQLRRTIADAVYSHPQSFPATGYGGSSLEFGGYLQRGFNDIGWLPETIP